MINKLQRRHPPLACTAVFPIGSTSCACWVLTAWPLNVKPRLGSKHKPWSLELCVCACVCKQSGEQQTCSKISWIYKLESYMWKSYALCQNLKANLTRRIIWIQNKTQSYKKIKTNIPTVEKLFSPVGCRRCWVQVRCCLVFTWWSSSPASCGPVWAHWCPWSRNVLGGLQLDCCNHRRAPSAARRSRTSPCGCAGCTRCLRRLCCELPCHLHHRHGTGCGSLSSWPFPLH